ncbi:MAG: hypothetical protein GFH27_549287n273 [Chloroflexi bacterium AL-W]|nr:hypothetical protein [Chloroflexi bacterium AL-W]
MNKPLKSRVWISNGCNYHFPELELDEVSSKPSIGVCFSGGGTRAMSAAMGQLRALNHLEVIPHVRYISSVSGGSWASVIYTYYRAGAKNDEELLGPMTPPEEITDAHLQQSLTPSRLAYNATTWLLGIITSWEFSLDFAYTSHDVWNYAVGQTYLESFGLFNTHTAAQSPKDLPYFSYDAQVVAEIRDCNPFLANHEFLITRAGRPFLIVNSCVLLPADNPKQEDLINFEYTPLTVGRSFLTRSSTNQRNYGGGFIEPFAYRGHAPAIQPDPGECSPDHGCQSPSRILGSAGWVKVPDQDRPFSLTESTGTSSSAFAEEAISEFDISRFNPQDFYWAVNSKGPYTGAETLFGDGGLLENNGIIPLIQRGIQLAIVFINTETKLDLTYTPTDNPQDLANDPNGRCDVYLPALFGYSNPNWPFYYPNNQVFPAKDFALVLDQLKGRKRSGEPLIVNSQHQVVENTHWGVSARRDPMWVTWCYLDRVAEWENQLCAPIQAAIQQGNPSSGTAPTGPYKHFPNYKTINQNSFDLVALTREQIVLLADLTSASILLDDQQTIQQAMQQVPG